MLTKTSTQHLAAAVALLVALCLLVLPAVTDDARALNTESFVPGQIIVKTAPGVNIGDINSSYGTRVQERFLDKNNTSIYLLETVSGSGAQETLATILGDPRDPRIVYAELNYLSGAPEADDETEAQHRHNAFPAGDATPTTKNYSRDSTYPDSALNLTDARKLSQGAGKTVAIIDTGAQMNHPALKARFVGIPRYDFVSDDKDPSEPPLASTEEQRDQEVVGHGTHVAGIVNLVAPRANLMPLRALDKDGYGSVFHVAEATAFADTNGANVINLSLGSPSWSRLLNEKVTEAIGHGRVVVAAAGNYNSAVQPQYPASRQIPKAVDNDGLLAVTSVDPTPKRSDFANYGTWIDIAAPGEEILSTYPVSRYAYWSGTSMATPFVAGEAALIQAAAKGPIGPAGVETRIRYSASCISDDREHLMLGAGHADIGASLEQVAGQSCPLL
ncbi:MAG: S8 family serine peptidase [Rubrobacteraceae bacterium]|nr:S8 family serine peptidase [Rubrobacteraceae bacterium]